MDMKRYCKLIIWNCSEVMCIYAIYASQRSESDGTETHAHSMSISTQEPEAAVPSIEVTWGDEIYQLVGLQYVPLLSISIYIYIYIYLYLSISIYIYIYIYLYLSISIYIYLYLSILYLSISINSISIYIYQFYIYLYLSISRVHQKRLRLTGWGSGKAVHRWSSAPCCQVKEGLAAVQAAMDCDPNIQKRHALRLGFASQYNTNMGS